MPTFDITSTVAMQEVRNATDQASREVGQRYDFKDTNSSIELSEESINIESSSDDRLNALRTVLEEKLVKRKVSLKALNHLQVEDAAGGRRRQTIALHSGINSEKLKEINKFIKGIGLKGVQSQTQGEQVRVSGKNEMIYKLLSIRLKIMISGFHYNLGIFVINEFHVGA